MDTGRIRRATASIEENEAALAWLKEHGVKITPRGDSVDVRIHINLGSACAGASEAQKVLSSYARLDFPKLFELAIKSCENTIEIEQNAILEAAKS
jgi:hypothetical protein